MRENQLRHAIVDLGPHLVAGDRTQFVARHLHRQVHLAPMADVDDVRGRARGIAPPLQWASPSPRARCAAAGAPVSASSRAIDKRQMRAALVVRHRVNLVDDHGPRGAQHLARPFGRQQDVQRFRAWSPECAAACLPICWRSCRACRPVRTAVRIGASRCRAPRPARESPPAGSRGSCERRCSAPSAARRRRPAFPARARPGARPGPAGRGRSETRPAFCPIRWAPRSARRGRREFPASPASAARWRSRSGREPLGDERIEGRQAGFDFRLGGHLIPLKRKPSDCKGGWANGRLLSPGCPKPRDAFASDAVRASLGVRTNQNLRLAVPSSGFQANLEAFALKLLDVFQVLGCSQRRDFQVVVRRQWP